MREGVPAGFDDGVDEALGELVVVLGGEGAEDLSLLTASHRGVLQDLAEFGGDLEHLAQVGEIVEDGLQCLALGGSGEERACVATSRGIGECRGLVA